MPHQRHLFIPFLPLIISLFFIKSYGNNNSSLSAYCNTTKCGDLEVKYPFWLKTNLTAIHYCGYQGFGLECTRSSISGDDRLILHLPSDDFYVKSISYTNHTVTLVDIDVTTNLTCPRAQHNLTLEDIPLNYSMLDLNLTFYFNCTETLPSFASAYPVDCLRSGENMSYVSLETSINFEWFEVCERKVMATVIEREINAMNNIWASMYGSAMNDGFVLEWSSGIECANCELSGGYCGYSYISNEFLCFCNDGIGYEQCKGKNHSLRLWLATGTSAAGVVLIIFLVIYYIKIKKPHYLLTLLPFNKESKENMKLEAAIKQYGSHAPRRYSYSDVKKMTNCFKDKLGKGGYGDVYKGNLLDGRPVAVKILKISKGSGEEFINEVATISRTSHVNIVSLFGFCLDGDQRALIYEFMSNGSLERYIHGDTKSRTQGHLGWAKLYQIALGIARGLEYLHRGCTMRILHFDIKPHNILLDEDFCPKISDFGLAKLCTRKESIISMLVARGTIGYIAPEVISRNFGGVSHKSDVYSFGMMLLEMVGGRKNISVGVSHASEIYFPHWVYQRMVLDEDLKLQGEMTPEEDEVARKMILVGLWCIQTYPSQRPAVSKVIEMLTGSLQALEIPPKPFFGSPSRSPQGSSTTIVGS